MRVDNQFRQTFGSSRIRTFGSFNWFKKRQYSDQIQSIKQEILDKQTQYEELNPETLSNAEFQKYRSRMIWKPVFKLWQSKPLEEHYYYNDRTYNFQYISLSELLLQYFGKTSSMLFQSMQVYLNSTYSINNETYNATNTKLREYMDSISEDNRTISDSKESFLIHNVIENFGSLDQYHESLLEEQEQAISHARTIVDNYFKEMQAPREELANFINEPVFTSIKQHYTNLQTIKNNCFQELDNIVPQSILPKSKPQTPPPRPYKIILQAELQTRLQDIKNNINLLFEHIESRLVGKDLHAKLKFHLDPLPDGFVDLLKSVQLPNYASDKYPQTLQSNTQVIQKAITDYTTQHINKLKKQYTYTQITLNEAYKVLGVPADTSLEELDQIYNDKQAQIFESRSPELKKFIFNFGDHAIQKKASTFLEQFNELDFAYILIKESIKNKS